MLPCDVDRARTPGSARRLLRDPLSHFLLGGLTLFLVFDFVAGGGAPTRGSDVIVVDRATLLDFVQKRTRAFDARRAAARLDGLSEAARARLVEDYVREEALHREALALGLDRDDYVIRRRLVQKLEFIAQGFSEDEAELDEGELERFFQAHLDEYTVAPHVTFTHVFFDAERRGWEEARREAAKALLRLDAESVPFAEATRHGDRFLYHVNYVERTPDYVASHFGPAMGSAVFGLEPGDRWHGPFESPYGAHLVLVSARQAGRVPELAEVRGRVEEDARRARIRERSERAIQSVVDRYEVRLELDPDPAAPPRAAGTSR